MVRIEDGVIVDSTLNPRWFSIRRARFILNPSKLSVDLEERKEDHPSGLFSYSPTDKILWRTGKNRCQMCIDWDLDICISMYNDNCALKCESCCRYTTAACCYTSNSGSRSVKAVNEHSALTGGLLLPPLPGQTPLRSINASTVDWVVGLRNWTAAHASAENNAHLTWLKKHNLPVENETAQEEYGIIQGILSTGHSANLAATEPSSSDSLERHLVKQRGSCGPKRTPPRFRRLRFSPNIDPPEHMKPFSDILRRSEDRPAQNTSQSSFGQAGINNDNLKLLADAATDIASPTSQDPFFTQQESSSRHYSLSSDSSNLGHVFSHTAHLDPNTAEYASVSTSLNHDELEERLHNLVSSALGKDGLLHIQGPNASILENQFFFKSVPGVSSIIEKCRNGYQRFIDAVYDIRMYEEQLGSLRHRASLQNHSRPVSDSSNEMEGLGQRPPKRARHD